MLAANYTTVRSRLKDFCDRVSNENETLIITRKDEKNVVIISLDEYNAMRKAAQNAAYVEKIDRAMHQLEVGECAEHELIEVDDD